MLEPVQVAVVKLTPNGCLQLRALSVERKDCFGHVQLRECTNQQRPAMGGRVHSSSQRTPVAGPVDAPRPRSGPRGHRAATADGDDRGDELYQGDPDPDRGRVAMDCIDRGVRASPSASLAKRETTMPQRSPPTAATAGIRHVVAEPFEEA